ncbi:3-phosphoshikimate 1-carboxyvinyltransferase [uncultured Selenomonas sp.]|uniref:3-phosphoshikimate 1-carboxyvinyltransferase n=1 Tax=uncultured Selenomonas sp. TaxID=159275 RepID=UPI0028D22A4A|nr:3-phosphoshikimate 1-carboxyvinyltransferase [uncultured Selenomonas sp.]
MAEGKEIRPAKRGLTGKIRVPGDKSVSHRSVMFSAIAKGKVHVQNFLEAADCLSTAACMRALGAGVERQTDGSFLVTGVGLHGLKEPQGILDAGNSGTTLRLLLGILAAQPFFSALSGDASLSRRPMGRVVEPLTRMGATIRGRGADRFLPLAVLPHEGSLRAMDYESPVASAQVKSAVLLAGLYAERETCLTEPALSRDHTERMLSAFGARIEREGTKVTIEPADELFAPEEIRVPGDISSAAYWLVAASLIEGSDIILQDVGVNPTRTGILDVLSDMGANITIDNERESGGEALADIRVRAASLRGTSFGGEIIPRLIDEIPILAVAALFADGDTVISGATELRVKETDRLAAVTTELNRLAPGAVEAKEDGMVIHGGRMLSPASCRTYDDHRMAMSLAVAGAAGVGVTLDAPSCVNISYPSFYQTLNGLVQQGER